MNAIVTQDEASVIESVVIGGDLSKLTPEQRVNYYREVCRSLRLNPLTKPFDYITLNGRLILYARKDAADQLRRNQGISIEKPDITFEGDWIIVTVVASNDMGRTDSDVGVVNKKDMQNNFGNALMKAVTKAKRRVTLSICGLGMLDETEIETIPDARPVIVDEETGEIIDEKKNGNPDRPSDKAWDELTELQARAKNSNIKYDEVNRDRVTTAELREYWTALNKKVKIAEEAKRLDGG